MNSTDIENAPIDDCLLSLSEEEYQLPIHIASVFIIMGFSFLGTIIPLIFKSKFSVKSLIFQSSKLFGAGVILSTAWIHMQTTASINLANPCLPFPWSTYSGFASLFALIGTLFTHMVQVAANQIMASIIKKQHSHNDLSKSPMQDSKKESSQVTTPENTISSLEHDECITHDTMEGKPGHEHTIDRHDHGHDHSHGGALMHSDHISVYLLELGIASHSILIGITLGVARAEFQTLFVALVFHQFFEGIALSSVVSEATFDKKFTAIFMSLFYTLMTPIGIAIGIVIQNTFNENSSDFLIGTGILDALSAGILIYDGLVNIVIPHFNGAGFTKAPFSSQIIQFTFFWLGTAMMAIIGIWA